MVANGVLRKEQGGRNEDYRDTDGEHRADDSKTRLWIRKCPYSLVRMKSHWGFLSRSIIRDDH